MYAFVNFVALSKLEEDKTFTGGSIPVYGLNMRNYAEVNSEPYQTSKTEILAKIVDGLQLFSQNVFTKRSILDDLQVSKCASMSCYRCNSVFITYSRIYRPEKSHILLWFGQYKLVLDNSRTSTSLLRFGITVLKTKT